MIPILLEGGPYDGRRVEISPGLWNSGVVVLDSPEGRFDYYRKLYVGSHGSKSYRWVAE